jgi:hypothetical protein
MELEREKVRGLLLILQLHPDLTKIDLPKVAEALHVGGEAEKDP